MLNIFSLPTQRVTIAMLTSTLLVACSVAPPQPQSLVRGDYTASTQYLTQLIQYEMKKNDVTGLSIALVDDQKIVWAQGFGYADKAHGVAATDTTVYRAGSISKLFTATAAMQLAEQGKLNIDQPLQEYLPGFSIKSRFQDAGPITPRNIMTHHSGLPGDLFRGMFTKTPEPFTNVVGQIKDEYLAYPPHLVSAYSNLGVTLLGHALQNVSGTDYAELMQRALLQPMGMQHSAFAVGTEGLSKAYRDGVEVDELAIRDLPAGGLNSNVLDLSRFMQMVFADGRSNGQQIIQAETLAEMLRAQNTDVPLDGDMRIGLGWMLTGDVRNGGTMAQHSGATVFHRAELALLPQHKLGVVVLSNSSTGGSVAHDVVTAALKLALQVKTGIEQPEMPKLAPAANPAASLDHDTFVGYYDTYFGFTKIRPSGDHLVAEMAGMQTDLLALGDGKARAQYKLLGLFALSVKELDETILSRANIAGHEVVLASFNNQRFMVGEKIRPITLSPQWLARLGDYEVMNADDNPFLPKKIAITQREGFLVVDLDGVPALTLLPQSDTECVIAGLGRNKQETVHVVTINGAEHIAYSGYLLNKKPGR